MENKTQSTLQTHGQSFIKFDKMVTPNIIQIIFYIGVALSVIMALSLFVVGGGSAIIGLFVLILGPLLVRVNCELIIVIFKIHEALQDLRYR